MKFSPLISFIAAIIVTVACGQSHPNNSSKGCVAVTGATGFVAGHAIELLLRQGFTVHGTVRDTSDTIKTSFLLDLEKELPGTLKLFDANLYDKNPFAQAFAGCWGLLHIATPVVNTKITPTEFVQGAVHGTLSALDAAKAAGMTTVVVTSSVATVCPTFEKHHNVGGFEPYTIEDYNDASTLNYGTYSFSKAKAENATQAWLVENTLEDGTAPFRYASIHFTFGVGPQQSKRVTSSNTPFKLMLLRKHGPFYIPLELQTTDIRDVARAHVHVLLDDRASGRYLVANTPEKGRLLMEDALQYMHEAVPEVRLPSIALPQWLIRFIASLEIIPGFDPFFYDYHIRYAHPGFISNMDTLDFEYKYPDIAETIQDLAVSMKQVGLLDPSPPGRMKKLFLPTVLVIGAILMFHERPEKDEQKKKRQ